MMSTTRCLGFLLAGLLSGGLLSASTAHAQSPELEYLRGEIREFLIEMRRMPPTVRETVYEGEAALEEAILRVDHLSEPELRALQRTLERAPYWRDAPRLLARSAVAPDPPTRRLRSALLDPSDFRARWTGVLERIAHAAAQAGDEELRQQAWALRDRLAMSDDGEIAEIERAMVPELPRLMQSLHAAGSGAATAKSMGPAPARPKAHCGSMSFPNDVICWIDEVLTEAGSLADTLVMELFMFVEGLFGDLSTALSDLGISLPTDAAGWASAAGDIAGVMEGALGIDFDDSDWYVDLLNQLPSLTPPCPDVGVNLPVLGVVGTTRANYECQRSLDWVAKSVYDNAPDDIWSLPVKTIVAFIYYPINYLCTCMAAQADIEFDRLQAVHRDEFTNDVETFTSDRFQDDPADVLDTGVAISNRATQVSVDGGAAQTADTDADVITLDGRVAALSGFTQARFADDPVDPLDVNVDIASRATQLSVDDSRTRVVDLDGDIVVITAKAGRLQASLDDLEAGDDEQLQFVRDLTEFNIRLRIEKNLQDDHQETISTFQLPETVGGLVETVEEIVSETIETQRRLGFSVAQAESRRDRALLHLVGREYKLAYDELRAAYRAALR